MNLPPAELQYPTCGACKAETSHDGDSFACYDCGLAFSEGDLTAQYINPDAKMCGSPCDNFWHRPGKIAGMAFDCGTCQLPTGHASHHYTNCAASRICGGGEK
jgi:hypothetical protein